MTAVVPGSGVAPVAATPSAASVQQFQALLQQGHQVAPNLQLGQHPNAIGRLISAEDKAMHGLLAQADDFAARAPTMNMNELVAGQMQMMDRVTTAMVHLSVGTSVAQGGKSAVQTLFKNQ
ncbi:type III secretion protein HrpB2 [Xanthomonas hyacinthi]|uniref:type III secretion protein HrpB2 n=1 Tax=Xanthomonas hyacinthi TaxID=56455 RepID=UPI00360BEABB